MPRKTTDAKQSSGQAFEWVPSKGARREYELRSGSEVLGRIRWPKAFGSLAEAEFGKDRWTFKRAGFIHPRVTIRSADTHDDFAVLELSWGGGGLLRTSNGRCFRWIRKGFWTHRIVFADESGNELVTIEPKIGVLRRSGAVRVSATIAKQSDLPLLLLLGWYVTMLITDDDATVVAVCCS